jgi:hypothetical protein
MFYISSRIKESFPGGKDTMGLGIIREVNSELTKSKGSRKNSTTVNNVLINSKTKFIIYIRTKDLINQIVKVISSNDKNRFTRK